tara:strand:- start:553 stop:738 length:186 start_codon:yes stop_codon:yes gene_type:complete
MTDIEVDMNNSTQFDYEEIKQAWYNYCNESLETFHYGFYLQLEKIAKKNEFKNRLGVSNVK